MLIFSIFSRLLCHGLFFVTLSCLFAEPVMASDDSARESLALPAEYGKIVYHRNGDNPQQVYIIGQGHRSAQTGLNGVDTVQIQSEIYRIGEWLIREKGVGLLLPEGFFQKTPNAPQATANREAVSFDNSTLHQKLADTRRFVNADMLLNASYHIRLAQVEDEVLYHNVGALLQQVRTDPRADIRELELIQEKRTAAMLQNIPNAVDAAFNCGEISNHKAMFTIGMTHLDELLRLLEPKDINPPAHVGAAPYTGLQLLERGYGVTVIVPQTLAKTYPLPLI